MEAVEKGRVEGETEIGERGELLGIVRVARGQHPGGCGGGFGEGDRAIEDGNTGSAAVEFEGEGETDNAGSGDADIGVLH